MFKSGRIEKAQKVQKTPGFSGIGNNVSLSFAIAEDATASPLKEGETVEEYASRHDEIPLTPLTTLQPKSTRVLGEASGKYEDIRRPEDDENDEPEWAKPDNDDDLIHDTTFTCDPAQNSAIFTTATIHDNTTGNMPPKSTFKLKSATTKARDAREISVKAMQHRLPTAEELPADMSEPLTDWPDRPATPGGGDEYQENLHAEPRMTEKYRMFSDDIEAMRHDLNAPSYNEANYENTGTPETPGKWVDEEWENRTHFDDLQPTNFYTALHGAPMEWKTKVRVDASGWDDYSDDPLAINVEDAKFEAIGANAASALKLKAKVGVNLAGWNISDDKDGASRKAEEVGTGKLCGMDLTKTCNHALCKSRTFNQTLTWSGFPTQPGFAADSASIRDTVAPGWSSYHAGVPEGTEIAFDTSAPGFREADQAARVANMSMGKAEKVVMDAADKIVKKMPVGVADAAAGAALEDTKAKKKHVLLMIKEKKERERNEAEEERQQAEKKRLDAEMELRKLDEELAGL